MVGRIPVAMNTVALVFLISSVRDSFLLAGIASSFYTLCGAIVGPRIGRLADRFGTRIVLLPITFINSLSIIGVVFFSSRSVPLLLLFSALSGATIPSFGSYTRTRWSRTIKDRRELGVALSLESVLDETAFVVGPALAGFLFSLYGSNSPLVAGIVFTVIGGVGLAITSFDSGMRGSAPERIGGLLRIKYVKALFTSLIALGLLFGSNFVVILAVAKENNRAAEGGIWVGLYPIGSLVAGLVYGVIHWKSRNATRYTLALAFMTLSTSAILFSQNIDTIVYFIILSGIGIAPALIAANALLKDLVPLSRLNEAFSMLGASISIGITLGSTLSGSLVDRFGGWDGFYFMTGATLLATLLSLICIRAAKYETKDETISHG
ncbi:MAG: MFS transporter [Candidatus Nanopelagicaceae bacterium]